MVMTRLLFPPTFFYEFILTYRKWKLELYNKPIILKGEGKKKKTCVWYFVINGSKFSMTLMAVFKASKTASVSACKLKELNWNKVRVMFKLKMNLDLDWLKSPHHAIIVVMQYQPLDLLNFLSLLLIYFI